MYRQLQTRTVYGEFPVCLVRVCVIPPSDVNVYNLQPALIRMAVGKQMSTISNVDYYTRRKASRRKSV